MLKLIYRVIILLAIFVISLSYFSRGIKEVVFDIDNTTIMEDATLPLVSVKLGDDNINLLRGYSSNLDANKVRDSIIPLGYDKVFELLIDEKDYEIKKINYEIREFASNSLIESDSVSVFDKMGELLSARIRLKTDLKQGKEYAAKITLVTSESKKIYYYQRIKIDEKFFLNEKLSFVMSFHEAIKDKKTAESIIRYLEPKRDAANNTLAHVNIHSSFELISWGKIQPVFLTDIIPSVKEINRDTASIELRYVIEAEIAGRNERYQVMEFYRVRYSPDRMYLLNYERYMESIFDISLASTSKSELKLGITNDLELPYLVSADKSRVAFVRDKQLWYYDLVSNEITRVFSFRQNNTDYIRDMNDQHDIRIINMDAEGNMYFLVFGYMNRGQYEGRTGLLLYHYIRGENRIEEKVYIPVDESYQIMKESIGDLIYVNAKDEFFFQINNSIYSYSLITKKLNRLASGIGRKQLVFLKDLYCAVWQEHADAARSDNIYIMNLETGNIDKIQAPSGYGIVLLDNIESNIIYGFVNREYISTMVDGYVIEPISSLEIAARDRRVLKSYLAGEYFISDIEVNDNIIELKRVSRVYEDGRIVYKPAEADSIMSQKKEKSDLVGISSRVTELALTEYYMTLPPGFEMKELPKSKSTVNTVIDQDPTLRLSEPEQSELLYYPFTVTGMAGACSEAADAILLAKEGVGVVMDTGRQLIWERGIKALTASAYVPGFDSLEIEAAPDAPVEGAIHMMLKSQGQNIPLEGLMQEGVSAYQLLMSYSRYKPIRLTGISLDDALYFVVRGRPVFAMTGANKAVVIYGYDAYNISIADPTNGRKSKMGLQTAAKLFEDNGNIFISYLE
ncbi:MAG: hypothetical protein GX757_11875 [Clostridiales bacterium]|nr:hypothetical protein [Clostridiales bacterium]